MEDFGYLMERVILYATALGLGTCWLGGTLTKSSFAEKIDLRAGEMFVVPKGVEHKPFAETECKALLVEPTGTINTGDTGGDLTAEDNVWI